MAVVGVLCLLSCTTPPAAPLLTPTTKIIDGGTAVSTSYRLSPGDDLMIRFPFQPDLNDEVNVGPDGTVALQYIDTVKLSGLTVDEAREALRQRYADVIKEARVGISIRTYALQQIYVSGQVNNPGLIRDTVPLTLSRAIAEAGGMKLASARTRQIIIVRRARDGNVIFYRVDMGNGIVGAQGDPLLQSYDLVYVPETPIYEFSDYIATNLIRMIPYGVTTTFAP
jgi:protein involved in polysaccharide export with SLBB domain